MKQLKIIVVCLILISSFGCEDQPSLDTGINLSKIENVQVLKDEAQRLSFSMLNEKEMQFIWDQHFQKVLSQNSLTDSQVKLIAELRTINKIKLFSANMSENSKREVEKQWVTKALKSFDKNQLHNLVYSFEPKLDVVVSPSAGANNRTAELPDCSCNTTSLFTCGELAECNTNGCLLTTIGCGFLWLWDCDGKCTLISPNPEVEG
jgi:hypothetical protein